MDNSSLASVAAGIKERLRHEGAARPYQDLAHCVDLEVLRLRGEGQDALAAALAAIRDA